VEVTLATHNGWSIKKLFKRYFLKVWLIELDGQKTFYQKKVYYFTYKKKVLKNLKKQQIKVLSLIIVSYLLIY